MNRTPGLLFSFLFCLVAPAAADELPDTDARGSFTIQFENDIFGALGDDKHYTQGVRLSYLTREENMWDWVRRGARALPWSSDGAFLRATWALGQNLYTPEDIRSPELIVDDRPYAAWLYGSVGLVADNRRSLDLMEFSVGVVGPAAMGQELQRWFHGIIASPDPRGWDHQLSNELTVQYFHERRWRRTWAPDWMEDMGLRTDLSPHLGAALGNVFIQAAAGGMVRLGTDLVVDYGPPRIRPSLPGSEFFVPKRQLSGYVFAGLEGRAVLRNIFLDGNTFQDSHGVEKYPVVGDFQGGIAIIVLGVRGAFTYVYRTREFVLQDRPDRFGAITLSIRI